jgi:hypothetical protein
MKLLNNLTGLITEIAAIGDITDAVKSKKVITTVKTMEVKVTVQLNPCV